VRLEGTLDAFSLPDIFQLLSFTKKTGTLHLRREGAAGAVHVRDGAITGARADVARHELSRRLLGTGLVDDEALASAAEALTADPSLSLAQLLVERAGLDADRARSVAVDQVTDAVFSLQRWPAGEFAFVIDETDPDDLGASVPVADVVAESERRLTAWAQLVQHVPAPDAVVVLDAAPTGEPAASREEWALLALVDGRRTVADLVALSGQGEYAVVCALAGLVGRGLLTVGVPSEDRLLRRHRLLAALEGAPLPDAFRTAADVPAPPARSAAGTTPALPTGTVPQQAAPPTPVAAGPVIPERPEPFLPPRRAEHAEPSARTGSRPAETAHGSVDGATARLPEAAGEPAPLGLLDRDPSINKSLLLRLIAGVRGL
jgi:hypothetical protein